MSSLDGLRAAFRRGDNAEVRRMSEVALAEARATGDVGGEVESLYAQARLALRAGDLVSAGAIAQEALDIAVRSGDRHLEERPRHVLAAAARLSGDFVLARERYLASIELNRELGQPQYVRTESYNLAVTELRLGNPDRARELLAEIRDATLAEDDSAFIPYLGVAAAVLASVQGDSALAANLIGFTERAFEAVGQVPDPDDAHELAELRAVAAADLGQSWFESAIVEGSGWTPARALEIFG